MLGQQSPVLFVVFSVPHAGMEQTFNRWMDEVHVPDSAGAGKVFTRCHRYVALGTPQRLYLHLWESAAPDLDAAMAEVQAHAMRLKNDGRIEQPFDVVWSQWLAAAGAAKGWRDEPVRSLVTLQNNWRDATAGESLEAWTKETGPEKNGLPAQSLATYIYRSGSASGEEGKFLSLVECADAPEQAAARWRGVGEPGPCPFSPYRTIFEQQGWEQGTNQDTARPKATEARVWVTVWQSYPAA